MTALSLNTVNEIMRKYYFPAITEELTLSGFALRFAREQRHGMRVMPFFDWWPALNRLNRMRWFA